MTLDGSAIVYCQGAFNTPNGKTAHGLVRFCRRYTVVAVVDSLYDGKDAGEVLDGRACDIPIVSSIEAAMRRSQDCASPATHLVVGLAPDGGRLSGNAREDVLRAIDLGLHVDCGLHDFLTEDEAFTHAAAARGVKLRDIRKPPERSRLHFFSGKIETVGAVKIAILGTDSAVGKRTTAWLLVEALERTGLRVELIGTGQTAWMQGARYSIVLDSLVNDFVSGEIEHAVWRAWTEQKPDVIVIEGQGSLMNPAYPGGFEILAAGRPDLVVLQHAPGRKEYDGFPGYPIHPLHRQIAAIEAVSDVPVAAVAVNHEAMPEAMIPPTCDAIQTVAGLPAFDVLLDRGDGLAAALAPLLRKHRSTATPQNSGRPS